MREPRDPRPPDLQFLIAQHGGFHLVTIEAWNEFDNAIAEWRIERLRAIGVEPISPRQMQERRRAKNARREDHQRAAARRRPRSGNSKRAENRK